MNEKQIFFFHSFKCMEINSANDSTTITTHTHNKKTKQNKKSKPKRERARFLLRKRFFWQMGERKHQHLDLFEKKNK